MPRKKRIKDIPPTVPSDEYLVEDGKPFRLSRKGIKRKREGKFT